MQTSTTNVINSQHIYAICIVFIQFEETFLSRQCKKSYNAFSIPFSIYNVIVLNIIPNLDERVLYTNSNENNLVPAYSMR